MFSDISKLVSTVNIHSVTFAAIVVICSLFFLALGFFLGRRKLNAVVKERLKQSRAVLGGLVSEQIAPLLPGFPYDPGDCRFVGKPIDFIIFKGMNGTSINEVVFLEIKAGKNGTLNEQEKCLRDAVQKGRVRWEQLNLATQ
ncbi:MAG: hypothetical protein LBM77_14110 [Spirochaetaceae bacterium]|jgi:predicted Holliday junction resolvase-like endonuclease|nr:hypothetical protein [Spirochaetaceae bacterium]